MRAFYNLFLYRRILEYNLDYFEPGIKERLYEIIQKENRGIKIKSLKRSLYIGYYSLFSIYSHLTLKISEHEKDDEVFLRIKISGVIFNWLIILIPLLLIGLHFLFSTAASLMVGSIEFISLIALVLFYVGSVVGFLFSSENCKSELEDLILMLKPPN